ncbi:MAG: aspartate carbamoyltransferase [Verrucomicrobiales bacterium]|nr:aspartate carbamoyltransferase [Verrucomicrobiales bacterium]
MDKNLPKNKVSKFLEPPSDSESLRPEANKLFLDHKLDLSLLRGLVGRSIIGVEDFTREQVIEVCKLAAVLEELEIARYHPLDGKLIITAFFEASTRTRLSFESAILRLDGKIISIADGKTTGQAKGESLHDIGEMFNAYADMVVMRHTETSAPVELLESLRIPLINAGNGTGEHPTQALADWYALLKWNNHLLDTAPKGEKTNRFHLGILGTPGSMRAVKSFLFMALLFQSNIEKVTVISEMADPFGDDVKERLSEADIDYEVTIEFEDALPTLDVIYMNSIALLGGTYQNLDARFQLNSESNLKKGAVILHPLARNEELDMSLDKTAHNLYFSQAHGAVFIRQALLMAVFNRLDSLVEQVEITE